MKANGMEKLMNEKQKVLIVHNYYQIPGGEDVVVYNEEKLLKENGHEVFLYSRNNSELKEINIFQKLILPFSTLFSLRTYFEVKKLIQIEKINVVHVHNTLNLISPSVYYAAFHKNVPVVQTVHNFRLLCPGANFYRSGSICEDCVEFGLICALKHNCYRNSKLLTMACVINTKFYRMINTYKKLNYICLTDFNKEKLVKLNKPDKKNVINPNQIFVKPNFTFSNIAQTNQVNRIKQFAYVGRLDELKGIKILLKAWKQLNQERLSLIICGIGPLDNWCRKYITENQLKNIQLMGFVSSEEAKQILADSVALILPTQCYEGFPMTIIESFSVGTPVIGSDIGNVGNLIVDGITGFKFTKDDTVSLVNAIIKIEKTSLILPQEYSNKYSAQVNYAILKEIYDTIGRKGY